MFVRQYYSRISTRDLCLELVIQSRYQGNLHSSRKVGSNKIVIYLWVTLYTLLSHWAHCAQCSRTDNELTDSQTGWWRQLPPAINGGVCHYPGSPRAVTWGKVRLWPVTSHIYDEGARLGHFISQGFILGQIFRETAFFLCRSGHRYTFQ